MVFFVSWFYMGKESTKFELKCKVLIAEIDYSVEITKIFKMNRLAVRYDGDRLMTSC